MSRVSRALPYLSIEQVQKKIKNASHFRQQQKWLIIYNALVDPRPAENIALHVGVSKRTVHELISRFNRMGTQAIETKGKGGRRTSYMSWKQEKQFLAQFQLPAQKGMITTITRIKQAFEQQVGHQVHMTTIYRLLHRHQWRKIIPRPHHPDVDEEKQREFKDNFDNLVSEALKRKKVSDQRPVLIMAQDEGRFGRLGQVMKAWCPAGYRPQVAKQSVRDYVYAYAAIAPQLGQMTSLILPYVNIEMMKLFLEEVSRDFQEYLIVMQVDQASWHMSEKLEVPENICLIPQTAYSPELNPVEHLWEGIRENYFYNQVFDSLEQVMDKLEEGLNFFNSMPEKLRSMTDFPHLKITF